MVLSSLNDSLLRLSSLYLHGSFYTLDSFSELDSFGGHGSLSQADSFHELGSPNFGFGVT